MTPSVRLAVPIGVSNRHLHLTTGDVARLLGPGAALTVDRPITQPGQFAARERIAVIGPRGRLDGVRIVGPPRAASQLELSLTDCRHLGVTPWVANSGRLDGSPGGVTLEGPGGRVTLATGVIVAARHLHCAPADAARWGLADGDWIRVACGVGSRRVTFDDLLVRAGPTHATEVHLDADEAAAADVRTGDAAEVVGVRRAGGGEWTAW